MGDAGGDAHPDSDFVSRDDRGQDFFSGFAARFRDGEDGGYRHRAGMEHRFHMNIVNFEPMHRGAIYHRGIGRPGAVAVSP